MYLPKEIYSSLISERMESHIFHTMKLDFSNPSFKQFALMQLCIILINRYFVHSVAILRHFCVLFKYLSNSGRMGKTDLLKDTYH